MTKKNPALAHIRALNDLRQCAARSCASEESKLSPARWDEAIAAAIAALQGIVGPVAVIMEGGICQGVVTNDPRLQGVPAIVIDYDAEGVEDDQIKHVDQGDGTTQEACIGGDVIGRSMIDLSKLEG